MKKTCTNLFLNLPVGVESGHLFPHADLHQKYLHFITALLLVCAPWSRKKYFSAAFALTEIILVESIINKKLWEMNSITLSHRISWTSSHWLNGTLKSTNLAFSNARNAMMVIINSYSDFYYRIKQYSRLRQRNSIRRCAKTKSSANKLTSHFRCKSDYD